MMKKKQHWIDVILVLLSVALLIIGGNYYISSMQNALWSQSVSDILEVTSQGTHALEIYLKKDLAMMDRLTINLSKYNSTDEMAILDKLELFGTTGGCFNVIDLERGVQYTNGIEGSFLIEADSLEAYKTLEGKGLRGLYYDERTGQTMFGYYEQFVFADGVPGISQAGWLMSDVEEEFILSFYNDAGFSYIVNFEGDIIVRSHHKNSNNTFLNVFEVIGLEGNNRKIVEAFHDSMTGKKKGVIRFQIDKENYIIAFVPIEGTEGWHMVSIIPDKVVMEYANQILNASQSFVFILGVALVVCGVFIFTIRRYRRNVKKQELKVNYRERLFSLLADNTNDVFLMISIDDFSVEYVSPNVERVLGVTQERVKRDLFSLSGANYVSVGRVTYDMLAQIEPGMDVVFESERVHQKSGEHKWFVETVYRTVIDDAKRYIVTISDRTQEHKDEETLREALEIAKAANESKSTFLSNMSHDIRTPMNAIVGLVTLLQRDSHNPEKVQEHTRKIAASSQHLLGLINDVLDMSKIESGKTTLNLAEVNLAELVDDLATIIRPQARAKQQEFEIYVSDISEEHFLGDKLRINQILINILSNAVKYTPAGGRIEMVVSRLPKKTQHFANLQFIVRDNGIGISPEYIDEIFQPFTRETNSTTSHIQGTGLGMAITKSLVDLMGGTISVENRPGGGSIFTVNLALRIQKQELDNMFWKRYGLTQMLLVDDDIDICEGILRTMENTGVGIQYVLSGHAAIEAVKEAQKADREFDLVLLDWKMPDMDGIETARRIRKILPDNVPIMILTAYDCSDIEEEGIAAGITGFMQKPFFLSNFMQTVQDVKEKEKIDLTEETSAQQEVMEGKKFLAAEDNELNAEILHELLEMHGASCDLVENGQKAVEQFEQSKPGEYDAIFMDVQMPVMDGYEAAAKIRAGSHPEAKTMPIIAMTANAFADDIKAALDAGMNAHVSKPIDMERLENVLRDIFEKMKK